MAPQDPNLDSDAAIPRKRLKTGASEAESSKEQQLQQISSFKGIWKFPSYREHNFNNAIQWMEARRDDEGICKGLWRVHDKLYNLESFIQLHPGGSDWISMTNGTDITEAFETSHPINKPKLEKLLAKYFVKNASTKRNSPYTFEENGFYKVLQRRAAPVLEKVKTGPTRSILIFQDVTAVLFLITLIVGVVRGSISLQILAGVIHGICTTCAHNFLHLKDNWRRYYFDMSLLSSYEWRLGHIMSHHFYPNTVMDYEVYAFEPFVELSSNKTRNWFQKYLVHVYLYIIAYSQYFNMEMLKRVYLLLKRKQAIRLENLIPLWELLLCISLSGSIFDGFLAIFIVQSVASFYLTFVGLLTSSHHHPTSFHEGDPVRQNPDFGLCALDITIASDDKFNENAYVAVSSFGLHLIHHLFPTVCHSKLHYLKPIVEEVLAEYSEEIRSLNTVEKITGIHYQIRKSVKTLEDKQFSNTGKLIRKIT